MIRTARYAALLLAVLLLAACGGADGGANPATDTPDGAAETDDGAATTDADSEPAPDETNAVTGEDASLVVYSGRDEELVGPALADFTATTGIAVEVRYGETAELAATILEEGGNSPADVFFAQDAGALGAVAAEGVLAPLPAELLDQVDARFRASDDTWVGVTGRARTLAYNTDTYSEENLPATLLDLTDPAFAGQIGWAPTNGSFQAFVTAMRVELGEDATTAWLEGMVANDAQVYESNSVIVEAVGSGEVQLGLVNHYYLYRFLAEDPDFPVANGFVGGDVSGLVNVAGVGVLATSAQPDVAEQLVEFLLSDQAQQYFSDETFEYPLAEGIAADDRLPALAELDVPDVDLGDLADLQATLELLRDTGALAG